MVKDPRSDGVDQPARAGKKSVASVSKSGRRKPSTKLLRQLDKSRAQSLEEELAEAREYQAATSEVLKIISHSSADAQPVFEAIVESAARLTSSFYANIQLFDGKNIRPAASRNFSSTARESAVYLSGPPTRASLIGRAILDGGTVHIQDVCSDPEYSPEYAKIGGWRAALAVPMISDGSILGAIAVGKTEPQFYSDSQVRLLSTFADQAVIAVENARLFDELNSSLERQKATSDILAVISSSPTDAQPVFEAIAFNSLRLCGAVMANVFLYRDGLLHYATSHNVDERHRALLANLYPMKPDRMHVSGRVIQSSAVVKLEDTQADPEYDKDVARQIGWRRALGVPMMRGSDVAGVIVVGWHDVGPIPDALEELLKSFADQAVIAIENTRLFNEVETRNTELTEALEQQTATADILAAISSSLSDTQPVFDAIVSSGRTLFPDAVIAIVVPKDGELRAVAIAAPNAELANSVKRRLPIPLTHEYLHSVAVLDRRMLDIPDAREAPPNLMAGARNFLATGNRALTAIPLIREGEAIGALSVIRADPGPLTDKQRSILKTFADQAIIAIQNARLLNELRDSLQQQTATADVLKVISRSAFDLQTVLDTLVESAAKLCDVDNAWIFRRDGDIFRFSASFGFSAERDARIRAFLTPLDVRPGRGSVIGRTVQTNKPVEVADVLEDSEYQWGELQEIAGYRSALGVPLLRDGETVGILALTRNRVQPFSAKQIELATTFADQAVIAMENARLFAEVQQRTEELSESLKQQTSTAELLKVISRSALDIKKVFEAVGQTALRLCDADRAVLFRFDGKVNHVVVGLNVPDELMAFVRSNPIGPGRHSATARASLEKEPVHILDAKSDPEYTYGVRDFESFGTNLAVPMLKGHELLGVITIFKLEVRAFTPKQIELVQTFADQAAIAIDNARLFEQLNARTEELSETLQQQIATAEVLKVISRSVFDLQSVLKTLVEAAAHLCKADQGTIAREQDGQFMRVASYGFSEEFDQLVRAMPIEHNRGSATGRALKDSCVVHIPDVLADPDYTFAEGKKLGGYRAILAVPMLREGQAIGVLALTRINPEPFSEKEIELVSTFADQAAIAIENVRLLESAETRSRELARSLEELRAAQDRLVQTEKLASLGQLTAGIAHEIKNPLNFVNNFSSVSTELIDELGELLAGFDIPGDAADEIRDLAAMLRGNLEKIIQHGRRANSIVKNMLLHARQGAGEHRLTDVNALVEESLNLAYHGARAERKGFNITLERDFDPEAGQVDLYPQEITRVLLNLISNGFYAASKREAAAAGNNYAPVLRASTRNLGDKVEVLVRDNGTGIPPEIKDRLFSPFFTTKPAGEGTGLGLSISHDIVVKQHRGQLTVASVPGEYTEFCMVLPRAAAQEDTP